MTQNIEIIKASDLNVSDLTFSDVKVGDKCKMIFVNRNRGKVLLQTPKMLNVFGGKRWDDSYGVEMSFAGQENDPELQKFHEILTELDSVIKEKILENSKAWLAKPNLTREQLESGDIYKSVLKISKDKEGNVLDYPDRFKIKFEPSNNGHFAAFNKNKLDQKDVLIFDEEKKLVDVSQDNFEEIIAKGSHLVSIVELAHITIVKNEVTVKFKIIQGKLFSNKTSLSGYAMIDDEITQQLEDMSLPDDLDQEPEVEAQEEVETPEEVEQEPEVETKVKLDKKVKAKK